MNITIQLKSTVVNEINLTPRASLQDFEKIDNFTFEFGPAFSDEDKNHFMVFFQVKLKVSDTHLLDLKYHALFDAETEISEAFKTSHFPEVNAPAIAFPFMRAFISTFLLNAGFEPILLPSFNFHAMYQEKIAAAQKA